MCLAASGLLAAWGCGGAVVEDTPVPGVDGGADARADARADAKQPSPADAAPDGAKPDAGKDALPEYVDPGCADVPPPIEQFECDPYAAVNPCGEGEGCYPFVDTPTSPCTPETYGALCHSAGEGGQGDPCTDGCQGGHVCVITGQGTQCVQLCDLSSPNPCPDGLVCGAVDVPGIGGCI
ncbi:MAG: hypothetical protein IT374_14470 [Polyangiaceae bacterium]|nr:hypothetical protein [Polyangiaceae bacterium]